MNNKQFFTVGLLLSAMWMGNTHSMEGEEKESFVYQPPEEEIEAFGAPGKPMPADIVKKGIMPYLGATQTGALGLQVELEALKKRRPEKPKIMKEEIAEARKKLEEIPGLAVYEDPKNEKFRKWFYDDLELFIKLAEQEEIYLSEEDVSLEDKVKDYLTKSRDFKYSEEATNMQNEKGETPLIRISRLFNLMHGLNQYIDEEPYFGILEDLVREKASTLAGYRDAQGKNYRDYIPKAHRRSWTIIEREYRPGGMP